MNDLAQNAEVSDSLFHDIIKCSNLIRSSLHHQSIKEFCPREKCNKKECNDDKCPRRNKNAEGHDGRHGIDAQRIGQIRLLSIILNKNGINQKELSELLMITPASVSELANKLEADGYIERKQNEDDKRVTNIFLTEAGRMFAERMKENRLKIVKNVFSSLDEAEQKQLLGLIEKVNISLLTKLKGEFYHDHLSNNIDVPSNRKHFKESGNFMHGRRGH